MSAVARSNGDHDLRRELAVQVVSDVVWTTRAEEAGASVVLYESTLKPTAGKPISPEEFAAWLPFVLLGESESVIPRITTTMKDDVPDLLLADRTTYVTARALSATWKSPFAVLCTSFAANEHWSIAAATGQQTVLDPENMAYQALSDRLEEHDLTVEQLTRAEAPQTIVTVPREFHYAGETFDDRFTFVGPCLRSRLGGGPGRRGRVYASLGTAFTDRPEIWRALAGLDVVGPGDDQIAVLAQAEVFVTHAGMGSVLEALWFGVRLVCLPYSTEQRLVARRVEELGLGRTVTPEGIRAAINEPACGRTDFVRSTPGAPAAADALERLL